MDFSAIVGQEPLVEALKKRLLTKTSHGRHLTLIGPDGSGKKTIAELYAQAMICERPGLDGSPCQTCDECKGVRRESSWAYVQIDAARQGDEETVRTLVERDSTLNSASVRIVLLERAELLRASAADAALKTLERETKTVFIFLVDDDQSFSGALRSRCDVFRLRRMDSAEVAKHLVDICRRHQLAYEPGALDIIAQSSGGAYGRAVRALARMGGLPVVTLSAAVAELELDWGPSALRTWRGIVMGQFYEAFKDFEGLGYNGQVRIRRMQAMLLELGLRNELGQERPATSPALAVVPEADWLRLEEDMERRALARSVAVEDLLGVASEFWRKVRPSTPWEVAFRMAYEHLENS
ncbi:hypothetical protein [Bradyrhizobium elkanii]|uniref:hypothetical protein n=1 Tax=Bradyrhizobium elkanii TaxID=29448 RepID=UPI0012FE2797|nr:hypothetical protein [Bradyrhizobium elkanii]